MVACQPGIRDDFSSDLNASLWLNDAYATVDGPGHAASWHNWDFWSSRFNFNTFLLIGTPREQHTHPHDHGFRCPSLLWRF